MTLYIINIIHVLVYFLCANKYKDLDGGRRKLKFNTGFYFSKLERNLFS